MPGHNAAYQQRAPRLTLIGREGDSRECGVPDGGGLIGGIALNLGAAGAAALEISSVNDGVAAIEAAGEGRWLAAAASGFFALPFGKFAKAGKVLKNIHGGALSADEALEAGAKWLGEGYEEIAPGVFRSADDTRQFRITSGDHVNFARSLAKMVERSSKTRTWI